MVAEIGGEIIAVAAHERVEHERLGPLVEHRYLMVVAVRADHRRSGTARVMTESVFVAMQDDGVRIVRWLVHPRNRPSIAFSRSLFPEADRHRAARLGLISGQMAGRWHYLAALERTGADS